MAIILLIGLELYKLLWKIVDSKRIYSVGVHRQKIDCNQKWMIICIAEFFLQHSMYYMIGGPIIMVIQLGPGQSQ